MQTTTWEIGQTGAPLPPRVPSLPYFGIAHKISRDPLAHFVSLYHEHGPIFRVKLLGRDITVLAGLDANRFLNTVGNDILGSEVLFGSFGRECGTDVFLTAMDGPDHWHLRRISRRGYSRSAMVPHFDKLLSLVDSYVDALKPGDTIDVLSTLQCLVTQQLGIIIAGRTPDDFFPDLQRFLRYNINVHVLRSWPKLMMKLPAYKKSKTRVMELGAQVLAAHRPVEGSDQRDLIDDLLTAKDPKGLPYDENMLLASTVGPYFAGIDTVAASLAFLVYYVLKHTAVHEQVRREADALYAAAAPSIREMKNMETLHGAAIETLRMYPVAPFTPRMAKEDFVFKGYQVLANREVFFAQTVTHYLPEYYDDPYTFNPQRFAKGAGRGTPLAFAPYTLGAHLCLGAGIAEAQMMLILSRLLYKLDLALETPDYTVKVHASPLPNPGRNFRIVVRGKR